MKEVEVKAHARDVTSLKSALQALGCTFSTPVTQDDTLYVRNTGPVETYLSNAEFLRLRVQGDGTVLFTLKYHVGRADDPDGAPMEYETSIGSHGEMERALLCMGFKEAVRVRKTRTKTRHEKWEVCIDDVEGLGSFIELEELVEEGAEVAPIHEAMHTFLSSLGITREDAGIDRYDVLMLQKKV
jgi:adenylate cyclase class 2